jgi:hypothetical protein
VCSTPRLLTTTVLVNGLAIVLLVSEKLRTWTQKADQELSSLRREALLRTVPLTRVLRSQILSQLEMAQPIDIRNRAAIPPRIYSL